jgi:sugar/nucleoside kinase (ribokinase family)
LPFAARRLGGRAPTKEPPVTAPHLDIVAIGNAIVDILAPAPEALVSELGLVRGGMQLVDAERASELYARMGPAVEASGGSAANTIAGMAALGRRCGFIGQVADDQFGRVFTHDIRCAKANRRPRNA